MKKLLKRHYDLELLSMEKSSAGAGSDTYFVTCSEGKYVVKYPASSEINHPEAEPELCEYLLGQGIPACQFLRNKDGDFLTADDSGSKFHVQRFMEGTMYDLNTAPQWLLMESAQMLGRIHAALRDYPGLPTGIGADFFRYMTPEQAMKSYRHSLTIAQNRGDEDVVKDLQYRIELMRHFPAYRFDLNELTCCATHGDYFISQIICGDERINAVIDWTTACVHPVIWEIVRSYVYAAPSCKDGQIDMDEFLRYVAEYRKFAALNQYDLLCMVRLFYYQIAVCDYYGQYYASTADNRHIYLHQAVFSTKLLRWLEDHVETLTAKLPVTGKDHCEDIQMNAQVKEYVEKYPGEIKDMYSHLRQLIFDRAACRPEETLWAKLPSYYVGDKVVRLIPFKDHINIEAQAVILHKEELSGYKITPKGMLQIFVNQQIPSAVLGQIFEETLG